MLRIGICDDKQDARLALRSIIERLMYKRNIDCGGIYEFSSAEGLLNWLPKHPGEIDVLFLDIELHEINGMDAARKIRENDDKLILVFVTGFNDYVFDGYTVGALDYLMKPPDAKRLDEIITRVIGILHQREPETYTIQNADGIYRIPVSHILYFMSDRRQVRLVTTGREYPFYAKLDEVEQQVGADFVRIHRRYLVRVKAIKGIEGNEVLVGEQSLPVSRNQRQTAMIAIAEILLHKESR